MRNKRTKLVRKASIKADMEDMQCKRKCVLSLYLLSVSYLKSVISIIIFKCLFLHLFHKVKQIPADLAQTTFRRDLFHVKPSDGTINAASSCGETERRTDYAKLSY